MSSNQSSSLRLQKATAAELSLLEKLDTIPALISVLANTLLALFTGPFRDGTKTPESLYKHVTLTAVRTLTGRTSARQQQYLLPPTDVAYEVACKKRGVKPSSEILEDGTRAHWIGSSKAEKLILNFHGGGYVLPASTGMVEFMFQIVDTLTTKGKNAACLFLSYDLAPGAIYPRQLQQASALLSHVVNNLKIKPENIILTGDSAGANLCTQLLSHLSHPHPSTSLPIPPITLSTSLRGVILISPWVNFDTSTPSFIHNEQKDCVSQLAGKKWSAAFMASPWPHMSNSDYYNQAATAPPEWWKDLNVKEVLIVAGAEEVLVDGIVDFKEKIGRGFGEEKLEFLLAEGEIHDQPSLDVALGYKEKDECLQAKKIKAWIGSKL